MKDESIVWDHGFKIFNYKTQEDIKKIVEDFSEFLIEKGIALWTLARQNKPEDRFLIEAGPTFDRVAQDFRTEMADSVKEQDSWSFSVLDCGVAFPLSIKGNLINFEKVSEYVLDLALASSNILIDPEYKNVYIVWKSGVVGTEKYSCTETVGKAWAILDKCDSSVYWKSNSEKFEKFSKWKTYCSYNYDLKEASEDTKSTINEFLSVRGLARVSFLPRALYINTNKEIVVVSDLEGDHWLCTPLSQFRFKEEKPPFDSWDSKLNTWEKNIKEKTMATLMNYVGVKIPRTGEFASKVSDFNWDSPNVMAALTCAVLTKNNGL